MNNKHNHAEAFCMMTYAGSTTTGTIMLKIWNSRDGVTPFMLHSQEFGITLQHVKWGDDLYMPDYKPKAGDLIWKDFTPKEARATVEKGRQLWREELEKLEKMTAEEVIEKHGYDQRAHLRNIISDEKGIERQIKEILEGHEPMLLLVEEDW